MEAAVQWFVIAGVLGSAVMGFAPPVRSEEQPPKGATEERIEVLDQRLRIVERKQENDQEAAAEAAKKVGLVGASSDGFFLKAPDGSYQFKLRGYIQSDGRFYPGDDDKSEVDTFVLRRVRPSFEGTVSKWFDFRFLPDWGNGQAAVQEAYLDIGYRPWARVRAGKFKTPFDLERLQSGTDIVFVERGFPTSIGPNRDVGLQLSGDLSNGAASYALGVFNGVVDGGSGDGDNHDAKDLAARLFAHPFRNTSVWALQGLGLGAAVTYGNQQGKSGAANLPSYKSPGQATFFSYGPDVLAGGTRTRLEPQLYYYWRSLSLATEYARSSQEVKKGETHVTLKNDAFQAAATCFLTGEDAGYKAPKIKDWDDLVRPGISVITPNPKTSGVARWNYLAGWGYALKKNAGDEAKAREFISALYKHVPVLDSGARGSTTTFVERGIGDVLINWENELLLIRKLEPEKFEIVVPSISILAEPTVAIVDKVVEKRGTRAVAQAYLEYLYSEEGQEIEAKNFYRPHSGAALAKYGDRFPKVNLFTIDEVLGGWQKAQKTHFNDGGVFDQFYQPGK